MGGLKRVSRRRTDALAQVGWQQVELLLADYYRAQGYAVEHCGTGGTGARTDGGVDLRLRRADEYLVVQVKHWNACKVPHNDVHQLLGLMVNEGATGAILVSSGEFTKAAIEAAARQGHVALVDGDELRAMLGPLPAASGGSPLIPGGTRADGPASSELLTAVVDRLTTAAEDRIRYGGRRRRQTDTGDVIAKLVGVVFALALGWYAIDRMAAAVRVAPSTMPARVPAAAQGAAPVQLPGVPAATPVDPCIETPDRRTGATIDRCAAEQRDSPPTAAEIREQQRRADDAIKVLEASTPEM